MTRCINHTILLLTAVCTICVQAKADDKSVIMSDLRSGKYSEAAARLKDALQGSPNDASLWTLNGFALVHLDKRKEALASYNRALDLSADYVPALEGAAEIEFAASDQRAVPLLNRLVEMNPRDETAHAMLAALAYKRDECSHSSRGISASSGGDRLASPGA